MRPSLLAIIARCNGNVTEAIEYCADIAVRYPHLSTEYAQHFVALREATKSCVNLQV
jgi:hypothetical protein